MVPADRLLKPQVFELQVVTLHSLVETAHCEGLLQATHEPALLQKTPPF